MKREHYNPVEWLHVSAMLVIKCCLVAVGVMRDLLMFGSGLIKSWSLAVCSGMRELPAS